MSAVTAKSTPGTLDRYRAAFEARFRDENALTALRREALDRFLAAGFPTQRQEDWKYTNLRRLEMRGFTPAERATAAPAGALDVLAAQWIAQAGSRVVLVNGHYLPSLSSREAQPSGVTLRTVGQWLEQEPAEVLALLRREQDAGREERGTAAGAEQAGVAPAPGARRPSALEDLNLAFFEDGVVLDLADGVQLDEPVYVVHQWNEHGARCMSHPRVIVRAGRNARCTLIEHFLGPAQAAGQDGYYTNAVTTIELAQGATLRHYRLQQESPHGFHTGLVRARVQAHARYACHDLALGAALGRTDISVRLEGPEGHVALSGLFVPIGTQHLDAHTRIEHVAPHTTSEEDYRGIAAGRGRGVFNGKVIVLPGAQKIDARQSSRNLLLSAGAEIDSKPELEIYADDVKCSHGATTGRLDAVALFYLRSRGLSEAEARSALIRAFARSVLATIEHATTREHVERRLDESFAAAPEVSA